MKKNIVLLSFATLLCSAQYSFARDTANPIQVKCFEAEGVVVYDVRGCVPGSDISFYSQQGGGEIMKQATVNAGGTAIVNWNQNTMPAFVLNVLDANASGIAGSGMVTFTGDKEFTVNDVALDNNSGIVTLKWNAAVNKTGNYAFEVLKSVNGLDYSVIKSVDAQGAAMLPYSFTDASQSEGTATYEIKVKDNNNDVYYTSKPLYADGKDVSVYPTVAHTSINVKLNDSRYSTYHIINMNGQVIISGSLNNAINNCSIATLPAGNYMIEISTAGNKISSTKFVKE